MNLNVFCGKVITPEEVIEPGIIEINNTSIQKLYHAAEKCSCRFSHKTVVPSDCEVYLPEAIAVPGFVDIHIHGAVGSDIMSASKYSLHRIASFLPTRGVTSFLPTTITAPWPAVVKAVENVSEFNPKDAEAELLGVHVEGPYINPKYKGAQPPEFVRLPSVNEFRTQIADFIKIIRVVTLAPEMPGGIDLIDYLCFNGIRVSMGHSDATYEQAMLAVNTGTRGISHIFNAMRPLHHREPGLIGCAFARPEVTCEVIWDGIHLHNTIATSLVKIKGITGTILVSDAISAAGLPGGEYEIGGQPVYVSESSARLADGTLAGSVITLAEAVKNAVSAGISLKDAVTMASLIPAAAIGVGDRKGKLTPGYDADIALLSKDITPIGSVVRGKALLN